MSERFARVGEVQLCYETFGRREHPAMLMVMGLGTQMLGWHEDFCGTLAERGFFVIRYDSRDCGRSTHFDHVRPPRPLEVLRGRPRSVAYTLEDMADDGAGLLDELGIEAAHVVGASMGGMIAQVLAIRHPRRALSLTSIMSTTGSRRVGRMSLRVYPFFLGRPPKSREEYVDRAVRLFGVVGSPGFDRDEADLRERAGQSYDRGVSPAGTMRQLAAILAARSRTADLRRVEAPTLVIHGTKDRMVAPSGGKATAKAVPGARLLRVEGMGHDLPRDAWPRIVDAIADHAAAAERSTERPAA